MFNDAQILSKCGDMVRLIESCNFDSFIDNLEGLLKIAKEIRALSIEG